MTRATRPLRRHLLGLAVALSASSGYAATTWNMNFDSVPCNTVSGTAMGNTGSCNSTASGGNPAPTAGVSAWSTTGSGSTFAAANLAWYGTSNGFGVRNATGGQTSGGVATGGIEDTNGSQHAMDNSGATDLIAFSFSQSVAINSVTLGWVTSDSDFSLLRWTGSSAPVFSTQLAGETTSTVKSPSPAPSGGGGWELVGNYNNTNTGSTDTTIAPINSSGLTSSWWLISAFNTGYGGATNGADAGNDYMKLLSIAGSVTGGTPSTGVPEPSSIALAGAALLGLIGTRRRKAASAA